VSWLLRAIWAVPQQTTTRSSGGLDSHPSHRYLTTLLADRPGLSALTVEHVDPFVVAFRMIATRSQKGSDGPGAPWPLGDSRWHGESGTVALSDQPIRLPHFASNAQTTFSIAWFEPFLLGSP
jgi:hypothetical protein